MEKEFLERCLAEGTVSYWLKKHGLEAGKTEKYAAKGGVAKEDLERLLAAGLSLREIAKHMDRSLATIRPLDLRREI